MTTPGPGVALTFDDGPDPEWTPRFLAELRRLGAPATFFVLGACAAGNRGLLRRISRAGHEIGLHGNRHLRHDESSPAEIEADAREALALIRRRGIRLWRPPHGVATTASSEIADRLGLTLVHWTADTVDWQPGQTPGEMLARVAGLLEPGAVVLMHDTVGPGAGRESPAPTLELLEPLVAAIRERGLEPGLIGSAPAPPLVGLR